MRQVGGAGVERKVKNVVLVETPVNMRKMNETAHEESSKNEKHDRKSNLSHDERTDQGAARGGRRTATPILKGRGELNSGCTDCRQHAEQKSCCHRDSKRETEHSQVGGEIQWNRIGAWRGHLQQHDTRLPCHRSSGSGAENRKKHRLNEQLKNDPIPRRTQSHAHGELARSRH